MGSRRSTKTRDQGKHEEKDTNGKLEQSKNY